MGTELGVYGAALRDRLGRARRIPIEWRAVIVFVVDGVPSFHLIVLEGTAVVRPGSHPHPTTVMEVTAAALDRVLLGTLDITHEVAQLGVVVRHGDYFDCIFLSKSLRGTFLAAV